MISMPHSEAVLWLLFNATWQSAILTLIVLLLIQLAGRWIPPAWRVVLWAIPLLRLVLLVLPVTTFSLFQFVDRVSASSPETLPVTPVESSLALPSVEPMPLGSPAQRGIMKELSTQTEAETSPTRLAWLVIAIWISGVTTLAARWLHLSIRLRRILTRKEDVNDPALQSLVDIARSKAKLIRSVRCIVTSEDIGPATCGLLRPRILISKRLARALSLSDLSIVIAHEVEHVRRCDFIFVTLGRVAIALHWFNPLAYFIHRGIQREIELAVDAATISKLGATRSREYGELLLRIASRANLSLGVVQMSSPRTSLRCRIEQLTRWRRPHWCQSLLGAAIACALALVGLSDYGPKSALAQSSADKDAVFAAGVDSNKEAVNDGNAENEDASEWEAAKTRVRHASGCVIDATGNPIPGARLFAEEYLAGGTVTRISATTDEHGEVLIEYPTTGRDHGPLRVWAYAPGHGVRVVNMNLAHANDTAIDRDIRLPPLEPKEFVIHLPSGMPCANAVVRPRYVNVPNGVFAADEPTGLSAYLPEELKPLLERRTDEDGRVIIETIPLALLDSIEVETPEYGRQHFRKLDRTLRLAAVGKISGLLKIESPKTFAGTKVLVITDQARSREITGLRGIEGIAETVLDAAGGFQIPAIAQGNVSMYLSWEPTSEAHPFVSTRPSVQPGEMLDLVIQVRPTVPVTGRVIASDTRQPIMNARIFHRYQNDDTLRIPFQVVTDERGRYSTRLVAGEVIIRQVTGVVPPYEPPRIEPITIPSAAKEHEAEDMLVNPMRLITGKLVDADNNAVSSATVVLHTGGYRHVAGKAETRADGSFDMRVRNWDYFSKSMRGRWYWATLDTPAVNAAPPQFTPLKVLDDNPDALMLQRP